ncbi:DUF1642 domain-containing protein [Streptococcus uberis]|uniref:DUF1642 domain-containing protein n=1 Tax=Streptococcus uberis TaxID=1349 RepID=UPI001939693A|nr:DUF1642 domain-containing protein [Streptococcus uberis]
MNIEEYKLGQKVSLYGIIEEINIEDIYDKENTTTLSIKTVTGKIHVNPKWEEVKLDQPKPVVPQVAIDYYNEYKNVLSSFDEWFCGFYDDKFDEEFEKAEELRIWLYDNDNKINLQHELALATLIVNGPDAVTVEKEKLYQIIDKRLNATFSCLGYEIDDRVWFWGNKKFFLKNKGARLAHTRQQLIDAGFEEVFENPNYEVKEVME